MVATCAASTYTATIVAGVAAKQSGRPALIRPTRVLADLSRTLRGVFVTLFVTFSRRGVWYDGPTESSRGIWCKGASL
jgi:hypothetical protein